MEENSAQNPNPSTQAPQPNITGAQGPLAPKNSPVDSQIPGSKPKKVSALTIIGTIIFLLLAGGAAAGFIYKDQITSIFVEPTPTPAPVAVSPSPTPDPTASWKTYTNTAVGYSFKYPSELLRDSREICTGEFEESTLYLYAIDEKLMKEQPNLFCGSDIPLAFRVNLTNKAEIPTTNEYETVSMDQTTIGGKTGNKYTSIKKIPQPEGISSPFDKFVSIHLPFEKQTLVIAYGFPSIEESIVDQILSTFKFIDSQTLDTSTWRQFSGQGFSFKYPSSYTIAAQTQAKLTFTSSFEPGNQKVNEGLVVNFQSTINSTQLKQCTENPVGKYQCISEPVKEIDINENKFREIQLTEGDGDLQASSKYIIQAIENPKIEFIHKVYGGGIETKLKNIVSTFEQNK